MLCILLSTRVIVIQSTTSMSEDKQDDGRRGVSVRSAERTLSQVGKEAKEGVKAVVHPVLHVFEQAESEEGTLLRKQIAAARTKLNRQLDETQAY